MVCDKMETHTDICLKQSRDSRQVKYIADVQSFKQVCIYQLKNVKASQACNDFERYLSYSKTEVNIPGGHSVAVGKNTLLLKYKVGDQLKDF